MRVMTQIHFDISNEEVDRLFMVRLEQLAGGAFFKNGVLHQEDPHHHGSITDSPVENPTAVQLAAVRFRDELTQAKSQRDKAEEVRRAARKFQEKKEARNWKRTGGGP